VYACMMGTNVTITSDTNFTPPATFVLVSNVFCTTLMVTNLVPAAEPFVDYIPISGVIPFDDYQMSADIFVDVLPSFLFFNPFQNTLVINRFLVGTTTGVSLVPLESTAIAPPTTSSPSTFVGIMPSEVPVFVERVGDSDTTPHIFMTGRLGTNVFNFERATFRCSRNVNGVQTARVYVTRTSLDYMSSCSVNYRIDHLKAPIIRDNGDDLFGNNFVFVNNFFVTFLNDEIPLQAGSDYALPPDSMLYGTDPDFESVTGTINFGANDNIPKPIDIPITNYNKVEFNEDFLVELYFTEKPDPQVTTKALGYVHPPIVTIMFND